MLVHARPDCGGEWGDHGGSRRVYDRACVLPTGVQQRGSFSRNVAFCAGPRVRTCGTASPRVTFAEKDGSIRPAGHTARSYIPTTILRRRRKEWRVFHSTCRNAGRSVHRERRCQLRLCQPHRHCYLDGAIAADDPLLSHLNRGYQCSDWGRYFFFTTVAMFCTPHRVFSKVSNFVLDIVCSE